MRTKVKTRTLLLGGVLLAVTFLGACRQDMHDQPRYESFEGSDFFSDGMAARMPIEGTVARGRLTDDSPFYTGQNPDGSFAAKIPLELTRSDLERGRERYNIFCSPCHGFEGKGDGMVVQRGYKQPPSFHEDRMLNAGAGYYYTVMTGGFGKMASYASQVPVADRWRIAAYIEALQRAEVKNFDVVQPVDNEETAADE